MPTKVHVYEAHLDSSSPNNILELVHVERETRTGQFPVPGTDGHAAASTDSKVQRLKKFYQRSLFRATASQICFTNTW
jgi:hypothetical protein